ncbi:MAG: DUF2807 domain-containing protein [Chitinophagales bacterium]|nr:DUF2807 domain-containing protein [Chitinophagales bacterium]
MKKSPFLSLILLLLIVTSSCVNSQNVITGKGEMISQSRNVSDFKNITLNVPGDVYLTQGNFNCSISAQQNVQDVLITEIKGDALIIRYKDHTNVRTSLDIKINVSLPALTGVEINGSGNVYAQGDFSSDKMKLEVNGSGNLKMLNVSASTFNAEVNGSGGVEMKGLVSDNLIATVNGSGTVSRLTGNVKSVKLNINGSGEIQAAELSGESVKASISGSGTIKIGVHGSLDAEVTGSGDVYYKGTPGSIHKDVTGSGSVSAL